MNKYSIYIFFVLCLFMITITPVFATEESMSIKRYGIFVGSNFGGEDRIQLRYADSDASAMAAILMEMGGLDKNDSILLIDPSSEVVKTSFDRVRYYLRQDKGRVRRTEFVFYYSGHSDEEGLLLGSSKFYYKELREDIKALDADVKIAILDSCSSGAFTRLKGGRRSSPFLIDDSSSMKGHAFLTSSSADEAAQESDKLGASFFTHYLISGLRGAADTTQDEKITLNEVYRYAFDETLARTENTQAGPQHPSYDIQLTGAGDLVLTDLRETSAGIIINETLSGRLFLRGRDGALFAEVNKIAGIPVLLAMPPGRYSITLDQGDQLFESRITLVSGVKTELNQNDFSRISRERTRVRGDSEDRYEYLDEILDDDLGLINEPEENEGRRVIRGFSPYLINRSDALYGTSIGIINTVRDEVRGSQIAGVANFSGGDMQGAQISGVYNRSEGPFYGFQSGGVFNIARESLYGGQASGVFNIIEGEFTGFQGSGVFNINRGYTKGFQGSGVFNISIGVTRGVQASGVFNIAGEQMRGVQMSGVFNHADSIGGVQMSLVNSSGDARGAQIGLVNVADEVRGTQIGLININRDIKGFPVGVLNISKNGLTHFQTWIDTEKYVHAGAQLGAKVFYTLIYAGMPYDIENYAFTFGLGLGAHIAFKPFYIDMDLSAKNAVSGPNTGDKFLNLVTFGSAPNRTFPSLRTTVGLRFFHRFSIFGGVTLDAQVPGLFGDNVLNVENPGVMEFKTFNLYLHPKYYIGIRI